MSAKKAAKKPRSRAVTPTFSATRLREDVDTYTEGIYALVALVNHARWSDKDRDHRSHVKYGIGRRMLCGIAQDEAELELTPDCVIQLSDTLGVIGEAKPGVARTAAVWDQNLQQLAKYNVDLRGWWTADGHVATHDIVALVPMSRAVLFKDLVEAKLAAGQIAFNRPFAVVAFFKQSGAESTFITLKTEFGRVSDVELNDRLRLSRPVNWVHLIRHYRDPKFMDAEPPLPYTLWVLWDLVFSQLASGKEPGRGVNWIGLDVEAASLTRHVQDFYGFRSEGAHSVEIPRLRWIRRALDALVTFGMAKRGSETRYEVRYRRLRSKDMLMKFGELCFRHRVALERREAPKPLLALAER
ncbi:MAG: hypothetical protein AB7I50_25560 [Vicinamibacterales bacterium]